MKGRKGTRGMGSLNATPEVLFLFWFILQPCLDKIYKGGCMAGGAQVRQRRCFIVEDTSLVTSPLVTNPTTAILRV